MFLHDCSHRTQQRHHIRSSVHTCSPRSHQRPQISLNTYEQPMITPVAPEYILVAYVHTCSPRSRKHRQNRAYVHMCRPRSHMRRLISRNAYLQPQITPAPSNIGITHGFSYINICRVPREMFEHEAARPSVQISSEGPGKCYCNEITMGDRCSCITYDSNGKF